MEMIKNRPLNNYNKNSACYVQPKALLIFNPSAGGGKALRRKKKVENYLKARNIGYDLIVTKSEEHLIDVVENAVHKYRVIVGAGGDTTINIIANKIIQSQNENILGIISMGSVNDQAREVGVHKLAHACNAIKSGEFRAIDVGVVTTSKPGEKYFFIGHASFGLGVIVNQYVDAWLEKHPLASRFRAITQVPAGMAGIYNAFKSKSIPLKLELGSGETIDSVSPSLLVFNNTSCYAGVFQPSPNASLVDGKLDCVMLYPDSFVDLIDLAVQTKRQKHLNNDKVKIIQAKSFKVQSPMPLEFQIDGKVIKTENKLKIFSAPKALNLLVGSDFLPSFKFSN